MKFVYFIILGLVVFNGVLILSAGIFNSGLEIGATDYTNSSLSLTNSTTVLDVLFSDSATGAWGSALGTFGVIVS